MSTASVVEKEKLHFFHAVGLGYYQPLPYASIYAHNTRNTHMNIWYERKAKSTISNLKSPIYFSIPHLTLSLYRALNIRISLFQNSKLEPTTEKFPQTLILRYYTAVSRTIKILFSLSLSRSLVSSKTERFQLWQSSPTTDASMYTLHNFTFFVDQNKRKIVVN